MIDKRLPRSLNNSADSRIRGVDEMTDALNILVTGESSFGSADGSVSGDAGVIKPINGNQVAAVLEEYFQQDIVKTVIGSVNDQKYGFVYFFVFSEDATEMGVYRVNDGLNVQRVFVSPYFNFQSDGFVKADVVHLNAQNVDENERTILYFTDNVNEPRKLDVNRALDGAYANYEQNDILDAICACPRTPVQPPTWFFYNDPNVNGSLFKDISPFQYAYQNIYVGGEESALSTYSTYAIPRAYVNAGIDTDFVVPNSCQISIPREGYTREVESIRILLRNSESNQFYIVDEVPAQHDLQETQFVFRNDSIVVGFPEYEVSKQFDNLPKRARAQTVSENRLFYGDYVEGFDPITTNATITVNYREREGDFVSTSVELVPEVFDVATSKTKEIKNRAVGINLSNLGLPGSISSGDVIQITFTINPTRNWMIYEGRTSFHPFSRAVEEYVEENGGINDQQAAAVFGSTPIGDELSVLYLGEDQNTATHNQYGVRYAGNYNDEVQRNFSTFQGSVTASWKSLGVDFNGEEIDAAYGTSCENALFIKGEPLTFLLEMTATSSFNNSSGQIESIVAEALAGGSPGGFDISTSNPNYSYSFNLGINHGDEITRAQFEHTLISGAVTHSDSISTTPKQKPIIGAFIVNQADVNTRIRHYGGSNIVLDLTSVDNVETVTVIPNMRLIPSSSGGNFADQEPNTFQIQTFNSETGVDGMIEKYIAFAPNESVIINSINDESFMSDKFGPISNSSLFLPSLTIPEIALHIDPFDEYTESDFDVFQPNLRRQLGYLKLNSPSNSIFVSYEDRGTDYETDATSILDGEVGPGARAGGGVFGALTYLPITNITANYHIWGGTLQEDLTPNNIDVLLRCLPYVYKDLYYSSTDESSYWSLSNYPVGSPNNQLIHLWSQSKANINVGFSDSNFIGSGNGSDPTSYGRSFKTNANHSFGIVYYDQRGRASDVMPLGSTFVQGLGQRVPAIYGAAWIDIDIDHDPPPWAWNYQIVYTGNTSVSNFIQYTTGGAFTADGEDDRIYISLNYLQENSKVSYAKSFGARNPVGDNRLYQYQEGDKLRIISYNQINDQASTRPNEDLVFDVLDFVTLTDDPESNPIYEAGDSLFDANSPKKGDFIVVRNRPELLDFARTSVQNGNDKWNNRCLVEIFSPAKFSDLEDKTFYETSNVYDVIFQINQDGSTNFVHEEPNITIQNGDVFFRRVPLKLPLFDVGNQEDVFQDMVVASNTNFNNFFVETDTFNDLVRFSNPDDFGKPKAILRNSQEVRRGSTITYGEPNSYSSSLIKFTSFNTALGNYKDIPNGYGSINYIHAFNEFLVCIQDSKISRIPVNRNIISDASTNQQLIATVQVLGNQSFFTGDYGCDGHPESVTIIDNDVYFADLGGEQVIRFNRLEGGVSPISENGMKEFFEREFRALGNNPRIVGGFDPLHDEFLISMYDQNVVNSQNVLLPSQPVISLLPEPDPVTVVDDDGNVIFELTPDLLPTVISSTSPNAEIEYVTSDTADLDSEFFDSFRVRYNGVEFNQDFGGPAGVSLQGIIDFSEYGISPGSTYDVSFSSYKLVNTELQNSLVIEWSNSLDVDFTQISWADDPSNQWVERTLTNQPVIYNEYVEENTQVPFFIDIATFSASNPDLSVGTASDMFFFKNFKIVVHEPQFAARTASPTIDPAQTLNSLAPPPQVIPVTPNVSPTAARRNQSRFEQISKGASPFSVAPSLRDGHDNEEIIEFWTNIYTASPGSQIVGDFIGGGNLDESPLMYIGGFYNYFDTGVEDNIQDHRRVFEEISNLCFIDCFGAGPVGGADFYKKGGVYTEPNFMRMAKTYKSVAAFAEANPEKVTGFNPNRVFDPVFIPGAFVTERKLIDSQWGLFFNVDNHENADPFYSDGSGTYSHFGKYGTMNLSTDTPYKIYDARIHGGVLAMIDYMPFRDYFRYKLHSVSPKFGIESVPESPETLVLHGFRDHGAVAGMGFTPYPGWAPCSIRTYAQWTEEIVIPFFDQFGGQQVISVLDEYLRNPGHDSDDNLIGGVPDENNMSNGHYQFFDNIFNQTNGGPVFDPTAEPGEISNEQSIPTYGPLVYDFDCDGVWGENDLAIWQALTQYWSSLGDDSLGPDDIEPLAANYFCPAHNAIKTVSRSFSGTSFDEGGIGPFFPGPSFDPFGLSTPNPQPGGIWNILHGVNDVFEEFTSNSLPISPDNRACFNWHGCLNQVPSTFVQPPGPPVSPVGAVAPYFNLNLSETSVITPGSTAIQGRLYNSDGTFYSEILIYSYPNSSLNFSSGFDLEERPTDSFFPITKYWA